MKIKIISLAAACVIALAACSPAAAPGAAPGTPGAIAADPQSAAMIQQCTTQGASQGATLAVCTCYVNAIKAGVTPEIFRILSTPENMRTPADLQTVASNPQVLLLLQTSLQTCRAQAAQTPTPMTPTPYGQTPTMPTTPSTGFADPNARAMFVQNCVAGGLSQSACACMADAYARHLSPQAYAIMARRIGAGTGDVAEQEIIRSEQTALTKANAEAGACQ